jgi:hypothetical protein
LSYTITVTVVNAVEPALSGCVFGAIFLVVVGVDLGLLLVVPTLVFVRGYLAVVFS